MRATQSSRFVLAHRGQVPSFGGRPSAELAKPARPHAARLIRAYGTEAFAVLGDARSPEDLGRDFGATLTEAELRWLMQNEWARRAADVVWRRSKLGLRLSAEQIAAIDDWMRARTG